MLDAETRRPTDSCVCVCVCVCTRTYMYIQVCMFGYALGRVGGICVCVCVHVCRQMDRVMGREEANRIFMNRLINNQTDTCVYGDREIWRELPLHVQPQILIAIIYNALDVQIIFRLDRVCSEDERVHRRTTTDICFARYRLIFQYLFYIFKHQEAVSACALRQLPEFNM